MMKRIWTIISAVSFVWILAFNAQAVTIDLVPVGNPGNANDNTGYGCVDYTYSIGKFEITTGQYCEFLNAVADTDTYGLYAPGMWDYTYSCKIERSGSPGSYIYSVAADRANRPVNWVSWGSVARFCNWLSNGQPSGAQGLATTEDGSYFLNGATTQSALMAVTRKPNATWVIPSENEWYKAAYHKNDGVTGNYWVYPTGTNSLPSNDLINPDPGNNANFVQNGYTIDSPYFTTEVGEFENSESPYGTFDQGGNALEWNESVGTPGSYRVTRGGSWIDDSSHLLSSFRNAVGGNPAAGNSYIGFRVAYVPEPSSMMSLLGLSVIGLVAHCWRRNKTV